MAENVFTKYGGKVSYTPERVKSHDGDVEYTQEDQIRGIALERDLTAANLLENDILLDMLDAAIDEQMKDFALTVPELADAAQSLCGGPTVTWECYKKAKELLRIAPWIATGYDPVQLTFTDKFQKRTGNVVFDCKQFDPDTFQKDGFDPLAEVDKNLGLDDNTETPTEIQKRATENQKKWALQVLFWDLLWGKAVVKPGLVDEESKKQSIEYINETIQDLKAKSQDTSLKEDGKTPKYTPAERASFAAQADALAKQTADSNSLPNVIMLDRPTLTNQLQWSDTSGSPMETNLNTNLPPEALIKTTGVKEIRIAPDSPALSDTNYPWIKDKSVAVWIDFDSLLSDRDHYKDKSIPAIKSGFILSILVGFLGMPPKVCFYFILGRFNFLRKIKWMKTKSYPVVGKVFKPIHVLLKLVIDLLTAFPVVVNTIFLEICIWLALLPNIYIPNVSDAKDIPLSKTGLMQKMEVSPTPAGFVSLDCFTAAQEIVNRVNLEAVN